MLHPDKTELLNKRCESHGYLLQVIKQAGGLSYQDLMREVGVIPKARTRRKEVGRQHTSDGIHRYCSIGMGTCQKAILGHMD
jgi:hypothetical protein